MNNLMKEKRENYLISIMPKQVLWPSRPFVGHSDVTLSVSFADDDDFSSLAA